MSQHNGYLVGSVLGTPCVIIPHEIYERCNGWMTNTQHEVSWIGLGDWDQRGFRLDEVFFPKQRVDYDRVQLLTTENGGDLDPFLRQKAQEGTFVNAEGECRYKLHMHRHPGDTYGDLFESSVDAENNENVWGKRARYKKWILVGRALSCGKYRVGLEIFQPFRCSIEHLYVYVEYKGGLHLVSEKGQIPVLRSDYRVHLSDFVSPDIFEDGVTYNARTEIASEQIVRTIVVNDFHEEEMPTKIPTLANVDGDNRSKNTEPRWDFFTATSNMISRIHKYVGPFLVPLLSGMVNGTKIKEEAKESSPQKKQLGINEVETRKIIRERQVLSVTEVCDESEAIDGLVPCKISKEDGLIHAEFSLAIGPWLLHFRHVPIKWQLPRLEDIRTAAREEAKTKISVDTTPLTKAVETTSVKAYDYSEDWDGYVYDKTTATIKPIV